LIHVDTLAGKGVHCCWMVVDDDTAQIYGRELLGYPKKIASITYREEARERVTATVSRRDVEIVSLDIKIKESELPPAPVLGVKTFNTGGLGQLFAVNPIWQFTPHEFVHESYSADARLTLRPSNFDPIEDFIAAYTDPLSARFAIVDIMGARGGRLFPIGVAGPKWFARTYNMRYR